MAYRKTRKLNKLRKRKKRLYCKTKRKSLRGGAGWFFKKRIPSKIIPLESIPSESIPFRLRGDNFTAYMDNFNFNITDERYMKMICLSPAIDDITQGTIDNPKGTIDKPESNYITGLVYGDMFDIRSKLLDYEYYMYNKQYTNDEFMNNYQIPSSVKNILNGLMITYIKINTGDYNIYQKISQQ